MFVLTFIMVMYTFCWNPKKVTLQKPKNTMPLMEDLSNLKPIPSSMITMHHGSISLRNPWETQNIPTTSKVASYEFIYLLFTYYFLAEEWNSSHFSKKKLDYLHLKDFSQIRLWSVLEATIDTTRPQDHCCLSHLEP